MKYLISLFLMMLFVQASFAQYISFEGKGAFPAYSGRHIYYEYKGRESSDNNVMSSDRKMFIIYKQWAEGKIRGSFDVNVNTICMTVVSKKFIGVDEGFGSFQLYESEGDLVSRKSFAELTEYDRKVRVKFFKDWTTDVTGAVDYNLGGCKIDLYTSKVELEFKGSGKKAK